MAKHASFVSSYKLHQILAGDDLPEHVLQGAANWLLCAMIVYFNVDLGPDIRTVRPATQFSEADFRTICFSCLPERVASSLPTPCPPRFHTFRFQSKVHGGLLVHGSCLFTQTRDPSESRGHRQQALVILSFQDFPVLFEQCLRLLQPQIDLSEPEVLPVLDSALAAISQWPPPVAGSNLDLGLLGSTLQVLIPQSPDMPLLDLAHQFGLVTSSPHGAWAPLLRMLASKTLLYGLYEHAVLGKPIVVYSPSPDTCSAFISCLLDLIRPLVYPPTHIRQYMPLQALGTAQFSLLGITNPLLLRDYAKDHNILTIDLASSSSSSSLPVGSGRLQHRPSLLDIAKQFFNPVEPALDPVDRTAVSRSNHALQTSLLLTPDHAFLSSLARSSDPGYAIRLHFATLTSHLVGPLSRHLYPLSPVPGSTPEVGSNIPLALHFQHFVKAPAPSGAQRMFRDRAAFYRQFVTSPCFEAWLRANNCVVVP